MSILTFLGTLLHVDKSLILLAEREGGEYVCSSDISCVLLVFTVFGGKFSFCLCDKTFILLSHLIVWIGLGSNLFSFFIINVTDEKFVTGLIHIPFRGTIFLLLKLSECLGICVFLIHHAVYSLCPFSLEMYFLQLLKILLFL